jgi:hypothetical protein
MSDQNTRQREAFWKFAKQDCLDDPVPDGDNGGVFLHRASRHLKTTLHIGNGGVAWMSLAPYALTIRLNDKKWAAEIADFFEGEGWVEEREHWRDGSFWVYGLDLEPHVVKDA